MPLAPSARRSSARWQGAWWKTLREGARVAQSHSCQEPRGRSALCRGVAGCGLSRKSRKTTSRRVRRSPGDWIAVGGRRGVRAIQPLLGAFELRLVTRSCAKRLQQATVAHRESAPLVCYKVICTTFRPPSCCESSSPIPAAPRPARVFPSPGRSRSRQRRWHARPLSPADRRR